ncbi:hypothetical protein [Roseateles sp.]|uniref:hypothetical protein n=1 Tax=Roseateles sp. TaxID=1971397 RepID=UPI0025EB0573|nr:hypothetical protein [Roseateles sp.]MBV8036863.1 hypothetical protein [Roseateles sp.]
MTFDGYLKDGGVRSPEGAGDFIQLNEDALPVAVPRGYVGPVYLSNGRQVWWTGRVAIGLRHYAPRHTEEVSQATEWLQRLMLRQRSCVAAAARK